MGLYKRYDKNRFISAKALETLTLYKKDKKAEEEKKIGEQSVYAGGWGLNKLGCKTFIIDKIKDSKLINIKNYV